MQGEISLSNKIKIMESGKLFTIISLVGGFIIGVNLIKLKKYLPIFYKKNQAEFTATKVADEGGAVDKAKEEVIKPKKKDVEPEEIKMEKPTEAMVISAEIPAEAAAETAEIPAETAAAETVEIPAGMPVETKDIKKVKKEKDIERSILDILKENPQGKTLSGLGQELKTPFVKLTTPIENLLAAGKVVRNGNIYSLSL